MRVVSPGGIAYLATAGGYSRIVRQRPPGMADWPTRTNETQGDHISPDSALRAPLELRWVDGPAIGLYGVNAVLSSADGRYFACTPWDAINIGSVKQDVILVARNAFNGLPLWRRAVGAAAIRVDDNRGVCAVAGRVFVMGPDRQPEVIGFDAATGEQVCTIAMGDTKLIGWGPAGDAIVMAVRPRKATTHSVGLLCADARTGATRWKRDEGSWPFLIASDSVYTVGEKITALDARSGAVRWQAATPPLGESSLVFPARVSLCYVEGQTLVVATKTHLAAYATTDGAMRWSLAVPSPDGKEAAVYRPGPYPWKGAVALGAKLYDLLTGRESGAAPAPFGSRCMPRVVSANYTIGIAQGRDLGLLDDPDPKNILRFSGMDSICEVGLMVANGMMYAGPSFCNCVHGKIEGFPAFGSAGVRVTDAEIVAPRPVVPGKGGQRPFDTAAEPAAWPVYRGDVQRRAASSAPLPRRLEVLWSQKLSAMPDGVIAQTWRSRVSFGLTAPTVAGGRVFVADAEAHRVLALSAVDGKTLWTFRAGGRIDTPPTIHQGRCIFGSHDGWVYCLRADDGTEVWRTRAAPAEQYVVAFGQVESAWPVPGSVAVKDGLVLLSAGRGHGVDGGLPFLALRLSDGSTAWVRNRGYIGDVPIGDGSDLFIGGIKVADEDLPRDRSGKPTSPAAHTFLLLRNGREKIAALIGPRAGLSEAGMMTQPPWVTHEGHVRSHAFNYRGRSGTLLAFDSAATVVANIPGFVDKKAKGTGTILSAYDSRPDRAEPTWSVRLAAGERIHGLALAADAVVVCGAIDTTSPNPRGFVRLLARDTGSTVLDRTLDGVPNWDPMALAGGRIYISSGDGRLFCLGER
jgi:outer membrane protein assembly factor BamB